MSLFARWCGGALITACASACLAQTAAPPNVDPDTLLRRARATWNEAERAYAFANWDRLFAARTRVALFDAIRAALDDESRRSAEKQ